MTIKKALEQEAKNVEVALTYQDKLSSIGKKASLTLDNGLTVTVKVVSYKSAYGNDHWQVTPLAGNGQAWVKKLKFID